ncbi:MULTISPECIES: DNA repair protein RadA [Thermaerobacter]|uniref:DNA repair protein RadA n=1 Tax=Thermaerobacter composti TaxID=554949 RepID=A0ABZ0QNK1_9FIRM|nr:MULTISPECIES: DNA repair protein RadA [Thermaerobacter]QBS37056.1 DNA repair protein RadA [Thermaerobacter sp. FW80]WPD19066.1 DNA repair protein RadA [Thermaerobacter composti]
MPPRTVFACQACGHLSPKWMGRCPECGAWNTFVEERAAAPAAPGGRRGRGGLAGALAGAREPAEPIALRDVGAGEPPRLGTGMAELDRVLGGGFVPGSVVLVGGDPGVGKSTLLLQVSQNLASQGLPVLYVTGEESAAQVRLRAQRLGALAPSLLVLPTTDALAAAEAIGRYQPALAVIDSIQTLAHPEVGSAPGSVSQVRESAALLLAVAKRLPVVLVLVGHVTRAGTIAGPRVVEHMVDAVLYFESPAHHAYRLLRAIKNRFGATHEIALFEMQDRGLAEVANPSARLLSERPRGAAGSAVVAAVEGTRPLLVEIQALVAPAPYGQPRRVATGLDLGRAALVMAVLDKRAGLHLGGCDVYLKVAGGVRVDEPALDLGLAVALASSHRDRPADSEAVIFGELGLAGEVRSVQRVDERVREAQRLGFQRVILPRGNVTPALAAAAGGLELVPVGRVEEAIAAAVG